jgi:hypothetical protein
MALQRPKQRGVVPSARLRRNLAAGTVLRASQWPAAGTQAPHLNKELAKLKSALTECNRGNGDACQLPREESAFGTRGARVRMENPYTEEEDGAAAKAVAISA